MGQALKAQEHGHGHDHPHPHHDHPVNEIGFGNYLSYLAGEKEFAKTFDEYHLGVGLHLAFAF